MRIYLYTIVVRAAGAVGLDCTLYSSNGALIEDQYMLLLTISRPIPHNATLSFSHSENNKKEHDSASTPSSHSSNESLSSLPATVHSAVYYTPRETIKGDFVCRSDPSRAESYLT